MLQKKVYQELTLQLQGVCEYVQEFYLIDIKGNYQAEILFYINNLSSS